MNFKNSLIQYGLLVDLTFQIKQINNLIKLWKCKILNKKYQSIKTFDFIISYNYINKLIKEKCNLRIYHSY